jgi:hypothetical protein
MKQSAYAKARDARIADEVVEDDVELRCPAYGCPHRWSVHGDRGKGCSAHYWSNPADWPAITERLLRDQVDRAIERTNREAAPARPLTREGRRSILEGLRGFGRLPADPRAWAYALQERHRAGEKLTEAEVRAYRAALPHRPSHDFDEENRA